jgi:hypothetical protein
MEPLAALGVAANVIQFVDFAHKLIRRVRELHESGHIKEDLETRTVTSDLLDLSSKLKKSEFGGSLSKDEQVRGILIFPLLYLILVKGIQRYSNRKICTLSRSKDPCLG